MKGIVSAILILVVALSSGCGDVQCDSDADCGADEVCAEAGGVFFASRVCVSAEPVASDMSQTDMSSEDGGTDTCVPRTSVDICAALNAECGSPMATECGDAVNLVCGQCEDDELCTEDFQCECVPESNEEFCARFTADCGEISNLDNCGDQRTVPCGTCTGTDTCGEFQANVCGCPCEIEGICYPTNAVNPNNPCQRCLPGQSEVDWSITVGLSCSDDNRCTQNDACSAGGECVGEAVSCQASSECRLSTCDPMTGACVEDAILDGEPCGIDDRLTCSQNICVAGSCMRQIDGGSCLIDDTCYNGGQANPDESCQLCRPFESQTDWSFEGQGKRCDDQGLNCVEARCNDVGVCVLEVENGECLIDGKCEEEGKQNPMNGCEECAPQVSQTMWTPIAAGATCGGVMSSCECDGSGSCLDTAGALCI